MEIKRFEYPMSVCKVTDYAGVNLEDAFVFLGGTDEERSLVCRTACVPDNTLARDDGWRMMRRGRRAVCGRRGCRTRRARKRWRRRGRRC